MNDIKPAMKLIGGVEPTAHQVQRVQAIAHSLGIASNDPMLPILIALDAYHGAFSALPAAARKAAEAAAVSAATQSKVAIDRAISEAILTLSPAAAKALSAVASDVAGKEKAQWIAAVTLIVVVAFTLSGWLTHVTSYSSGFNSGKAEGYQQAKDEKAAVAWANTTQGRLAFELAQAGSLEALAHCSNKGWEFDKKEKKCTAQPVTEGGKQLIYGWGVGKSATGTPSSKMVVSWLDRLTGG